MTGAVGLLVGERFLLVEPVGEGAMGRVWRGHDERLDREVALKEVLLSNDLPAKARERLIARAMVEAKAAARLRHPGIVTVHDVILHGGAPWIVMELLDGPSLGSLVARGGRLGWGEAAAIGLDVADALAHAHAAGVVHRDLKPDNVLRVGGRGVITDFGIARIMDSAGRLTSAGTVMGTPQFMPPEQLDGGPVGAPADLWALGATLYAVLEGSPPFNGSSWTSISEAVRTRPVPPAPHAGPLAEPLLALMGKDPATRPDANAVGRLLRSVTELHRAPTMTTTALDGTYWLVNAGSGLVLDASGAGTADGTPVIQWLANGGANQQWTFVPAGDGYHTVISAGSGKALDAPGARAGTAPGTQLVLWEANGGTNQQWLLVPGWGGHYTLESRADRKLVDVGGASPAAGAEVVTWPANGGANQLWYLVRAG